MRGFRAAAFPVSAWVSLLEIISYFRLFFNNFLLRMINLTTILVTGFPEFAVPPRSITVSDHASLSAETINRCTPTGGANHTPNSSPYFDLRASQTSRLSIL